MESPIITRMNDAVQRGIFPGAVLLVGARGRILLNEAFGYASLRPRRNPMSRKTRFDLASLTKPLATTTALMLLVQDGKIRLSDAVSRWIPSFQGGEKARLRVFHLLNHSSGFRAGRPFYHRFMKDRKQIGTKSTREAIYQRVHEEKLSYSIGSKSVYSDFGFILAGEIIETVSGQPLDRFCKRRIFVPLNLPTLHFRRVGRTIPRSVRYAATEKCPWRKRVLLGEVHDGNSFAMGGVAGHAGLFGTAWDVYQLTRKIQDAANGVRSFISQDIALRFLSRMKTPQSSWALGWDTPSLPSSSGHFFSSRSFGHLGFTGCSIWADLDRDIIVVLLTNRIHPSSRNNRIRAFRPMIHDLIIKELA